MAKDNYHLYVRNKASIESVEKRVEKLEKLVDTLYSLDVIQNYSKYRKVT